LLETVSSEKNNFSTKTLPAILLGELGESSSCWIVENLSNILFFKVPVGISLGLNVIAFIWTILGITNVRKVSIATGVNISEN
jgi:hypothetical protein